MVQPPPHHTVKLHSLGTVAVLWLRHGQKPTKTAAALSCHAFHRVSILSAVNTCVRMSLLSCLLFAQSRLRLESLVQDVSVPFLSFPAPSVLRLRLLCCTTRHTCVVLKRAPWYLLKTVKLPVTSSKLATGVKKSRGLARPLAPIGPRLGSWKWPSKISQMYPLQRQGEQKINVSAYTKASRNQNSHCKQKWALRSLVREIFAFDLIKRSGDKETEDQQKDRKEKRAPFSASRSRALPPSKSAAEINRAKINRKKGRATERQNRPVV